MKQRILVPLVLGMAFGHAALAASPEYMQEDCKNSAQVYFQD